MRNAAFWLDLRSRRRQLSLGHTPHATLCWQHWLTQLSEPAGLSSWEPRSTEAKEDDCSAESCDSCFCRSRRSERRSLSSAVWSARVVVMAAAASSDEAEAGRTAGGSRVSDGFVQQAGGWDRRRWLLLLLLLLLLARMGVVVITFWVRTLWRKRTGNSAKKISPLSLSTTRQYAAS